MYHTFIANQNYVIVAMTCHFKIRQAQQQQLAIHVLYELVNKRLVLSAVPALHVYASFSYICWTRNVLYWCWNLSCNIIWQYPSFFFMRRWIFYVSSEYWICCVQVEWYSKCGHSFVPCAIHLPPAVYSNFKHTSKLHMLFFFFCWILARFYLIPTNISVFVYVFHA